MTDTQLPRQVQWQISTQQIGHETLIYDEIRHRAFCLNRTSATIWKLCDGAHTVQAMAEAATVELQVPVGEVLVHFALMELRRDGLLQPDPVAAPLPEVSRRKLMRMLGTGAVAMLPVVAVVMAPTAAQAYTGCADCLSSNVQQREAAMAQVLPQSSAPSQAEHKTRMEEADPWRMKSH